MQMFMKFVPEGTGATAIEYGLIATLISVVIITAVSNLRQASDRLWAPPSAELHE